MLRPLTLLTLFAFFSLLSFSQPGTPLPTFGNGGLVTNPQYSTGGVVKIQNGKLLVRTGNTFLRYNLQGELETSFLSPSASNVWTVQADGKLLFASARFDTIYVLRTSADGVVDNSFGTNGIARLTIRTSPRVTVIDVQRDGKIVCAGIHSYLRDPEHGLTDPSHFLARFNADGTVDPSFGTAGAALYDGSWIRDVPSILIQSDNKILLATYFMNKSGGGQSAGYKRFNTDGSADGSINFSAGLGGSSDVNYYTMVIQQDGKIIVNSTSQDDRNYPWRANYNFTRLNPDGSIDNSFGASGVVTTFFPPTVGTFVQADGKFLVAGTDSLARFNADGSRDQGFGTGGSLKVQNNILLRNFVYGNAALLGDTLYLSGVVTGSSNVFAMAAIQLGNGKAPEACLISGGASQVCQFTNTTWSGPEGMDSYQWTGPNGFSANTREVSVSVAGTYTLNSSKNGVQYTCSRMLSVTPLPTATITSSGGASSSGGLTYRYYEGSWERLPDFGGLSPVASGRVANVTLPPRKRDEQFAMLFQGKITIPKAGRYYFETASDDGSRLYIGGYGHYVTPVVDNDGLHGTETRGGWYSFPAAGQYEFAVSFFEQGGEQVLRVYWGSEDAGIPMHTPIPDAAFGAQASSAASLTYKYYEGAWTRLPDFGGLTPLATGKTDKVDIAPRKRNENFAFLWEGTINIPKAGTYYFETASDDGSRLYIGNYGHYVTPVVDNDGQHALVFKGGFYTFPQAGAYPIAISYFEATGIEGIFVYWTAPEAGIPTRTLIPGSAFTTAGGTGSPDCSAGVTLTASEGDTYLWSTGETTKSIVVRQNGSYTVQVTKDECSATSAPMVVNCIDNSMTQTGGAIKGSTALAVSTTSSLAVKVLPNPSASHFTLQVSTAKGGERITLRILDAVGRVVETKVVAAGTSLQVGSNYRPGTYIAHVVQGSEKVTLKLVKTTGAF